MLRSKLLLLGRQRNRRPVLSSATNLHSSGISGVLGKQVSEYSQRVGLATPSCPFQMCISSDAVLVERGKRLARLNGVEFWVKNKEPYPMCRERKVSQGTFRAVPLTVENPGEEPRSTAWKGYGKRQGHRTGFRQKSEAAKEQVLRGYPGFDREEMYPLLGKRI